MPEVFIMEEDWCALNDLVHTMRMQLQLGGYGGYICLKHGVNIAILSQFWLPFKTHAQP